MCCPKCGNARFENMPDLGENMRRCLECQHIFKVQPVITSPSTFLRQRIEELEADKALYERWFELHGFSTFDILSDVKHANELEFTKEKK